MEAFVQSLSELSSPCVCTGKFESPSSRNRWTCSFENYLDPCVLYSENDPVSHSSPEFRFVCSLVDTVVRVPGLVPGRTVLPNVFPELLPRYGSYFLDVVRRLLLQCGSHFLPVVHTPGLFPWCELCFWTCFMFLDCSLDVMCSWTCIVD